ncbi:hypothetical protein GR702_01305 [Novosphingobium sp. FGD1]|uniref:Uncharacterized protein n=1 Tax=Novosphingobium silvae TaxID=2692619 RepID=A0A7X4K4Y9_9SPHN|nr:hypothetical protein [Novosphingobium silvae]MYL96411.1 hypothetical protein [Novosphingobium silvae]
MRLNRQSAPATRRTPPQFTFICNACECVEHTRSTALPKGWTRKESRRDIHVYCGPCTVSAEQRVLSGRRQ